MATGDLLAWFPAHAYSPPDADPATPDHIENTTPTPDPLTPVLDFDDSTDEFAEFEGYMPGTWTAGNGVDVILVWTSGATTGNVRWAVQFISYSDDADSLAAKAFDTAQFVTAGAPSAANEVLYDTIAGLAQADIDNIAPDEFFKMRIYRDADDGTNDTLTGDASLIGVALLES